MENKYIKEGLKEIYKTAIRATVEAGKEIMNIYNDENFQIETKNDDSPLTVADRRANEIITNLLLPTGIPIISEENKQLPYSERKNWDECWIVDPLDGTKEFIKKNGEFTVNIALCKNGIPVFGVIYVPVKKEIYLGDVLARKSFKGVLQREEDYDWDSLNFSEIKPSRTGEKIRVVGSRSHMNKETLEFIEDLKKRFKKEVEVVTKGSSLKFCLVAEGEADVYPRFAPTMEWDTAAGQAICNAVGLEVWDQNTSKGLLYNRENLLNNFFLISNLA